MKKIKNTKLSLKTETIKLLNKEQMGRVAGGYTNTCLGSACTCANTYGPECATMNDCPPGGPSFWCATAQCNPSGRGC